MSAVLAAALAVLSDAHLNSGNDYSYGEQNSFFKDRAELWTDFEEVNDLQPFLGQLQFLAAPKELCDSHAACALDPSIDDHLLERYGYEYDLAYTYFYGTALETRPGFVGFGGPFLPSSLLPGVKFYCGTLAPDDDSVLPVKNPELIGRSYCLQCSTCSQIMRGLDNIIDDLEFDLRFVEGTHPMTGLEASPINGVSCECACDSIGCPEPSMPPAPPSPPPLPSPTPRAGSVRNDPHLRLPHGGRADFRGEPGGIFNFVSAANFSLNVLTAAADFRWNNRIVHGTKVGATFWTVRTPSGLLVNIEMYADEPPPNGAAMGAGNAANDEISGSSSPPTSHTLPVTKKKPPLRTVVHVRTRSGEMQRPELAVVPGGDAFAFDGVVAEWTDEKTLQVTTNKWVTSVKRTSFPFASLNKNARLLNLQLRPADGYDPERDPVSPHGLLGQAFDGDGLAVDGATDTNRSAESTTSAQAEGAIEGTWRDYRLESPFATDFKFSRFNLKAAKPRDPSKLRGIKRPAVAVESSTPKQLQDEGKTNEKQHKFPGGTGHSTDIPTGSDAQPLLGELNEAA